MNKPSQTKFMIRLILAGASVAGLVFFSLTGIPRVAGIRAGVQPQDQQVTQPASIGQTPNKAQQAATADRRPKSPTKHPTVSLVYSPGYLIDLAGIEKLHPFDIRKYEKIHRQLIGDNILPASAITAPQPVTEEELLLVHTADYLNRLKKRSNVAKYLEANMLNYVPFSLEKAVLEPFRLATGGTILAARRSLETGIAINLGGGYHHAKPDIGEGFCLYADVPIAIRKLQKEGLIKTALVIDVDVHQGNGTAVCLANDQSTFTFSMHQGDIYPQPKETSDRDVELQAGDGDEAFLAKLEENLDDIIKLSKADICFIVGGCDPLADDPLASLKMTPAGIAERDGMIIQRCVKNKIPVVLTLAGGYSKDAWRCQYESIRSIIKTYGHTPAAKQIP